MSTGKSDVEMDLESDDDGYYNYYNEEEDSIEIEPADPKELDPEYFEFKCLTADDVNRFLNESVEFLCNSLPIKPSLAKLLLHLHGWTTSEILNLFRQDASKLLIDSRIKPVKPPEIDPQVIQSSKSFSCSVCLLSFSGEYFYALACGHYFCKDCWSMHFELQIFQGLTTNMECMGQGCSLLVPEDFVFRILNKSSSREKYQVFSFSDYIKSHPQLRFCTGPNCDLIIFAKECQSKRVICKQCKTTFCFKCGADYHVPSDCETIKRWLIKCIDDSETANYITANTKDCPKCNMCIEKNGGCNHMVCYTCKCHFCWMCLKEWNDHGYTYRCSMYEDNPNVANGSVEVHAREALKKYLFYYERWENHAKSLRLEEQTLQKIKEKINKKVMANEGTWIDWQYLLNAAALLAKCRYTLQYTYPYAYYMESGPRKELFEYQQAQLEAEIENLSFKIERAETTDQGLEHQQTHLAAEIENLSGIIERADRGDLENQMDVAEKRRATLLKDFSAL